MEKQSDFPKLGAPARRALSNAGISSLADLAKWKESDVAKLHGMGPSSIRPLKEALKDKGMSFAE